MVNEAEKIMVGLNSREIELFKRFREHQENFEKLLENGFFDIKGAAGVVHFDENSQIRKIEVPHIRVYNVIQVRVKR